MLALGLSGCALPETYRLAADCAEGKPGACAEFEGDADGDRVKNGVDNCRDATNSDQKDLDRDGDGDVCDWDRDGDGVLDLFALVGEHYDRCPDIPGPPGGEAPGCPPGDAPPRAPTGLTATANNDFSVSLDWADNPEPDLREYRVYRRTSSSGAETLIATVTASQYRDTGLEDLTTYYYFVRAVDAAGQASYPSADARARSCGPPEEYPSGCPPPGEPSARAASRMSLGLQVGLALTRPRQGLRASVSGSLLTPGTVTRPRGLVVGRNALAAGRFRGRLVSGRGTSPGAGVWRSRFDFRIDPRRHTVSVKGFVLLSFRSRRQGQLCIRDKTTYVLRRGRLRPRGSFETRGGTGASRTLWARGTYSNGRVRNGRFDLRGTGRARQGRPRGLPRACRRLKPSR